MISTTTTRVWTNRGWLFAEDLCIDDKVISFNPERNCCEYDSISSIEIEYKRCRGLGIFKKTMTQLLTPDHPLLIWNNVTKTLKRKSIEDSFMGTIANKNAVLYNRMFEPYLLTHDMEIVKWSARRAATYANYNFAPENLWPHVLDLGGYESQVWIDTFLHWNVLQPAINWMGCVRVKNKDIRDMVLYIAPRAGVGAKSYLNRGRKCIYIADYNDLAISASEWMTDKIDGHVFNITTKNGNVLLKSRNGTYLAACNLKGEQ